MDAADVLDLEGLEPEAPPKQSVMTLHILEAFEDAERLGKPVTLRLPKHGIQVSVRLAKGKRQLSLRDGTHAKVNHFLARVYASAASFARPRIEVPGHWDKKPIWLVTDVPGTGPGLPIPASRKLEAGLLYGFEGHSGWCTVRLDRDRTTAALGETYHMRDPSGVSTGGRERFDAWLTDHATPF